MKAIRSTSSRNTRRASRWRCGPGLPRFCGGLAGYFGYDTVRYIERKLAHDAESHGGIDTPDILLLQCEELAVIDNLSGRLYLIVYADPREPEAYFRAKRRLTELGDKLRYSVTAPAGEARCRRMRWSASSRRRTTSPPCSRQGIHRGRRHDAGADRPAPEEALSPNRRCRCTARCAR